LSVAAVQVFNPKKEFIQWWCGQTRQYIGPAIFEEHMTNSRKLLLMLVVLGLSACSSTPLTPSQTAQHFWAALLNGDTNSAAKFATQASKPLIIEKQNTVKDSSVSFGKITLQSDHAKIETSLQAGNNENSNATSHQADPKPAPANPGSPSSSFETVLQREQQQWLVDFVATQQSFEQARQANGLKRLVDDFNQLGHQFSNQLDNALKRWDNAQPQIKRDLENLGDSVQKDLQGAIDKYGPELQRNLQDFTESIDKAIKELHQGQPAPKQENESAQQPKGRLI